MTPLLAHARRGERAFERLYRRHVGDVYRYVLVVLRNPEDAEDVTQTTFLNAYRAYGRGERPRNARAWLIAIAHNVCRQRFRTASRRPLEVDLDDDHAAQAVPDEIAPTAGEIRRALDQLAFNQRAALVMRELEGRSYAEIAEVLSLSVGAVETLVFRARRALREQLEGNLSCHEAERAISRQIDGVLARPERGALRAHLRECEECARFARSQRAQRPAWKALGMVPLPASLESFFGHAGAVSGAGAGGVAMGVAAKTLAVAAIGASAVGVGYEGAKHQPWSPPAAKVEQHVAPAAAPLIPVRKASIAAIRPAGHGQSAREQGKKAKVQVARPVKAIKVTSPGHAKRTAGKLNGPGRATKSAKLKKEKSVPVGPAHAIPVRARGNPSPPGHAKREEAKAKEPVGRKIPTPPGQQPKLAPQFPPVPPLPLPELPVELKPKKAK
ncbi:MAG TPA: sigma-70 family RNA polymerase sigma factor [Vicinamibacteria bacterium]|jgi:RNA polymerase sigma factor (sigma-70 family)